jgi:four helix bundle protein
VLIPFYARACTDERTAIQRPNEKIALGVVRLADALPQKRSADVIGKQIIRSATSVGANYRAACRARSTLMMIAKLDIVLEEADETLFWLEILAESGLVPADRLVALMTEANEIIAMTTASLKTLRTKRK